MFAIERPLAARPISGNLVNFFHVSAPCGREEHQVIVRGSSEKVLDEIAFLLLGCAFARLTCQSRLCRRAAARETRSPPCA